MVYHQPTQQWDAQLYASHGSFVSRLGADLLSWLSPRAGESILDLGCGDGALTVQIAATEAQVVGVDQSPALVAQAARLGLEVYEMDAHDLPYEQAFDAVFSNAALHWMTRPEQVLVGVHRALRAGGRFVAEMGAHGNIASVLRAFDAALGKRGLRAADHNPWYFPRPEVYRRLLEEHGFRVSALRSFQRPTRLPGDLRGWVETFGGSFVRAVPLAEREALIADVLSYWRGELQQVHDHWVVDYVRLRFCAQKIT